MIEVRTRVPAQESGMELESIVNRLLEQGIAPPQSGSDVAAYVARWAEYPQSRVQIAEDGERAIGWLGVMVWDGGYATMHPLRWSPPGWPSVVPGEDEQDVGVRLIAATEAILPDTVRTLLTSIDQDVPLDPERLAELRLRYERLGFHFADLVHFIHPTADLAGLSMPEELAASPIGDVDPEALVACIRDVFSGSASPFFCGGAIEEQESFVRTLPGSPAMAEPASVVLTIDGEMIGFASTVGDRDNGNLLVDWMGIRPAWRQRGYGRFLLSHILSAAKDEAYATVSLSSDEQNSPALALYKTQGWEIEGGERQFVKQLG